MQQIHFPLNPLAACIRLALASGMFFTAISPVQAQLPVAEPTLVSSGAATAQTAGNTMTIRQTSDKATLNWQSFNVGANNHVDFQQPSSSSIALNRINDANPSQILGEVSANGQVYLYNGNGFVFGENSVVNANTVIASTMNITDEALKNGITQQAGADSDKPSLGEDGVVVDGSKKIEIQHGAKLHVGKDGLMVMAAPQISNKGSLSADKYGQIILVASKDKVYLQATDKNSPFHGLLVEVDKGGTVTNEQVGEILARQGNITLEGFAVNQQGRVTATTSVNENGSIRLLAQEQHKIDSLNKIAATKTVRVEGDEDYIKPTSDNPDPNHSKVTFGSGSVTRIIADAKEGGTAIDAQAQRQSVIDVVADKIEVQANATVKATGGKLNMIATDDLSIIQPDGSIIIAPSTDNAQHGRILIDKNAKLDVSGTKHVSVPMSRNVAEVSVQSYELRDAPNQKTGVLKGATIEIDIRKDTAIVDTTGAKARVERGIDERLGNGGEINFTSNGDTVVNSGASVDISGGSVDYQSGTISTTQLVTDYGSLVDISNADPKEHYAKIADNKTIFEQGYSEGQAAGAINVQAPVLAWDGNLTAGSEAGRNQRAMEQLPFGGAFIVNQQDGGDVYLATQNIRFANSSNPLALGINDALSNGDLVFNTDGINRSGLQDIVLKTSGNVSFAKDTNLQLATGSAPPSQVDSSNAALSQPIFAGTNSAVGGYLAVDATSITVDGNIDAPNGTINLATHFANTADADTLGKIDIGSGASLNVSGRWVNDLAQGFNHIPTEALAINGGTVKMSAIGDLTLAAGSKIKADAGAWLGLNNTLTQGKAGTIDLAAIGNGFIPSLLTLNGDLSAYGMSNNGTLSLSSGKIVVGKADATGMKALELHQNGNHFSWAGFSKINLSSRNEKLVINNNSQLQLTQQNFWLNNDYQHRASNDSLSAITYIAALPDYLRQTVSLTLAGLTGVRIDTGSDISVDKQGSIALNTSQGSLYVDGSLNAPAGKIALTIKADPLINKYDATQVIWLGNHSKLVATGTVVMRPIDNTNRRSGDILGGGEISLLANRGYVFQQRGSRLNVSGTKNTLDLADAGGSRYVATEVGSNAGKITLASGEGIVLNGSMLALAGSRSTAAGRLEVLFDRNLRSTDDFSTDFSLTPAVINLTQTTLPQLDASLQFGNAIPSSMSGQATLSSDLIKQAGFGDVRLGNNQSSSDEIHFVGNVNLATAQRLDLSSPKISADGNQVQLASTYLKIGTSEKGKGRDNADISDAPTIGESGFVAKAKWLDLVGSMRWDGFKQIALTSQHDMRAIGVRIGSQRDFIGSFNTSANLQLTASQLYPTTLSNFSFTVTPTVDNNGTQSGTISINGKNTDTSPLAANGVLSFTAPVIHQDGVLKAAFGTINLNASNSLSFGSHSVTSVSGKGQMIPFGVTQGGVNWLYPLDAAAGNLVFNNFDTDSQPVPIQTKQLNFNAPEINMQQGSIIDVSGGGDLQGYEFQTGAGGTNDYLAAISSSNAGSYNGGFAVVPSLGSALAPYDPAQQNAVANLSSSTQANFFVGSQIHLSGSAQLPAGNYTILPPRYALLTGAFLITPQANSLDNRVTTYTKDGLAIVSGYQLVAGTGIRDSRWQSFLIESGSEIRKHSQYDERTANDFFTQQAATKEIALPAIPKDSGQISLTVDKQLVLAGQINSAAQDDGRGAKVDISASAIEIVKQANVQNTDGSLTILDSDLSNLNLDSLLLGGTRSINSTTGSTELNVTANKVVFDAGVKVSAKDLLATAKDSITVNSGATLSVSDKVNTGDTQLDVSGDGALLRLSGDKQVQLQRTDSTGDAGDLIIAKDAILEGATLKDNSNALQSALLNASNSNQFNGELKMTGGSLRLDAKAIALGEVDKLGGDSLNLSNSQLASISVDDLQLHSQQAISLYGNVGKADNTPLQFGALTIDSAGLVGVANQGKTAKIQADTLVLENTNHAQNPAISTGNGSLVLTSTHYTQGDGAFNINGFNNVKINVAAKTNTDNSVQGGFINAEGDSQLNVAANLTLTSDYLTATGGSTLAIDATGHTVSFNNAKTNSSPSSVEFGGTLQTVADSINLNSQVILPSGTVRLTALKHDVTLGSEAKVDLAGRAVQFADTTKYTAGGSFNAGSVLGKVILAKGSSVNLNAGDSSVLGGSLNLSAPKQSVDLSGTLQATNGSTSIDVAQFSAGGFDALAKTLSGAGVNQDFAVRSRNQDIYQGATTTINAKTISLVADKGVVDISGKINAQEGGSIGLYAGDKISLESGSQLNAKGGKVLLSAVDTDTANDISINTGSSVNANKVILRAARTDDGIAIDPIKGSVTGYTAFYADAVKQYDNSNLSVAGEIHSTDIAQIKADTDDYMSRASATNVSADIVLRPSIAINVDGDLVLKSNWDFADWRYNGVAGSLAVNASGNLSIAASVTDGFANDGSNTMLTGNSWSYQWVAGADLSSANSLLTASSHNLNIGKDAPVIDTLDGVPQVNFDDQLVDQYGTPIYDAFTGNPIYNYKYTNNPEPVRNSDGYPLPDMNNPVYDEYGSPAYDAMGNQVFYYLYDSTVSVHTGTGDINLASGADVIFKNSAATVYNAGRPDDSSQYGRYGSLGDTYGSSLGGTTNVEYPVAGGDVVIQAARDIQGAVSAQFISAWLPRIGDWGNGTTGDGNSATPTAWGVVVSAFTQNIGSFGGGNVQINAGGSINDLSVMMPTTGKQIGNAYADGSINPNTNMPNFSSNDVQVNGGGSLQMNAAGNIAGGAYLLGKGAGTLNAGGAITGGTQFTNGVQLVMGDSTLSLNATQGVAISGVSDVMSLSNVNQFYSYSAASGISVNALSGDVQLGTDTSIIRDDTLLALNRAGDDVVTSVYPASLQTIAFGGSIVLDAINLFPAAITKLELLAKQNISSHLNGGVTLYDVTSGLLPTATAPKTTPDFASAFGAQTIAPAIMHGTDTQPARIVTQQGDITDVVFNISKHAIIQAGRDFSNLSIAIQNINPDDVSLFSAGRDIRYNTTIDDIGNLKPTVESQKIEIAGPGNVLVKAGRNVDLGAQNGLLTVGNKNNANLPVNGANLNVLVGLNGNEPNYSGFINYINQLSAVKDTAHRNERFTKYLNELIKENQASANFTADKKAALTNLVTGWINTFDGNVAKINQLITGFMRQRLANNDLSETEALTQFNALNPADYLSIQPQLNLLTGEIFFNELKVASNSNVGNENGFKAIDTLFPKNTWQGDLSLILSGLETLQGGDINLFVPGGNINAGLAFAFPGLEQKKPSELGIIAQGDGSINAFVQNNFEVNQSRVFTQGQGDILVWSGAGDVDAGRGSKSSLAVPETLVNYKNEQKNTLIQPAVSGSGIRAADLNGNVYLVAPKGVVNAGEAGIGATNVSISATAVLGSGNIQVGGGSSSGVATVAAPPPASAGASNTAASVSQSAQQATTTNEENDAANKRKKRGKLTVKLLGFG
ncbi:MAG: filamentous hemagglutinin family protein [Methylococcaceae bacterium]